IVMANPNPEDPNVPNEDVLEEDPYHLLDYDEEEDPKMDIEEEEPEEDPVEEAGDEPEVEGADVELEAEEPDGAPEATIGTGSQRPFAVRDFPIGFHETGQSSTARVPQFVGGLAPWVLRRDLEALHRQERIKVAESETKMVRKGAIPKPPSDDEGFERPRKTSKKSDGDEGPSDPRGSDGNADGTGVRGAGLTVPELTGCTYATFIKCDPLPFNGTKGAVGLCQWFEKLESVFQISGCKEKYKVKFAMATLRGRTLT
nr:putative zinc finger, CCHC-type, retrotransposon Gag domain protein [Tanacetum cinerariifolium]